MQLGIRYLWVRIRIIKKVGTTFERIPVSFNAILEVSLNFSPV